MDNRLIKIVYLFFIIAVNPLIALPRFALEQGSSCMNCHVNPTGAGMRNDYGSNIYNLDELTVRKWISKSDEDWDGYVTDNIHIGGEFRLISFEGNEESGTFPMQAEIYGNIDINKDVDFYFELPLKGENYDFFLLFDELPNYSWIKLGQSSPNYGLMVDDHTAFIKSGNRTSLSDNNDLDKGFRDIFNPILKKPLLFEWGINFPNGLLMTIDLSQNINDSYSSLVNYSTTLNYTKDFDVWSLMFGSSLMNEEDMNLRGIFGGFSVSNVTMTFEIDKAENLFGDNQTSIASYAQFVYKPIQGLHLIAKYDYFDHDYDQQTGSISRFSYGLEFYPLNMLEIKFQAREYSGENNDLSLNPEYLIQIHTWF